MCVFWLVAVCCGRVCNPSVNNAAVGSTSLWGADVTADHVQTRQDAEANASRRRCAGDGSEGSLRPNRGRGRRSARHDHWRFPAACSEIILLASPSGRFCLLPRLQQIATYRDMRQHSQPTTCNRHRSVSTTRGGRVTTSIRLPTATASKRNRCINALYNKHIHARASLRSTLPNLHRHNKHKTLC